MANFTRDVIRSTFGEMLVKTPFEKITVSSLIKACHIGRNTFYYHYQDIYELLDDWLQMEFGKFATDGKDAAWEEQMKAFLRTCKANKRKVYHLYNSISRGRIEQYVFTSTGNPITAYIQHLVEGRELPPQRVDGIIDICRYALIGHFLHYLWNGMNGDIDTSVDELSVLLNDIVERMLLQYEEEDHEP